jgi:acetyltransferase-like isoleucine patch superfamily enzyme
MNRRLHKLIPGLPIENDWCNFPIPMNMEVGENTLFDSSSVFKKYFSARPLGIKIGSNVTIEAADLATEPTGYIEIGDYCYLALASLVSSESIIIGNYVFIGIGTTIVDTDFHPVDAAQRMRDTIAISTVGDRKKRPSFETRPVIIEDDVWIGYNSTILKGVTIGKGSIVQPGSVVSKSVPPGSLVSGNPAQFKPIKDA